MTLSVAVLGPGGVGGLLAGALDRAEQRVVVVAREPTADLIAQRGLRVDSVRLGRFVARPRSVARLREPVDALIVATKATGLEAALERIDAPPALVLPLLNGLDHLAVLREHFSGSGSASAAASREGEPWMPGGDPVVAGAIRVESDRPEPGVIVHTSPFLRVDMASRDRGRRAALEALARGLQEASVPVRVLDSEPQVMWSKLVRLTALACTTSAFDLPLGDIRRTPELRAELVAAVHEGAAVARAEGAGIAASDVMAELEDAHAGLGSSMRRDIAAGRTPELDAVAGSVLRAAARHGLACPAIERLVALIVRRSGTPAPLVAGS